MVVPLATLLVDGGDVVAGEVGELVGEAGDEARDGGRVDVEGAEDALVRLSHVQEDPDDDHG